jgi:hypothetical protein
LRKKKSFGKKDGGLFKKKSKVLLRNRGLAKNKNKNGVSR